MCNLQVIHQAKVGTFSALEILRANQNLVLCWLFVQQPFRRFFSTPLGSNLVQVTDAQYIQFHLRGLTMTRQVVTCLDELENKCIWLRCHP